MLQRAAGNAYSWWWASHVRTKQSKWLEQNLQDFEEKVGNTLKLIEEEGDSFAKRAQMYYNNRPELILFVQEAFRTYRALAERYDHLSTELQKANTTIATVFPERIQLAMDEEDEFNAAKNSKKLPQMGNPNAPKAPAGPVKDLRSIFSMAAKKSSKNLPKTSGSSINKVQKSGLSKAEGLEKIDRLQKEILVMQTEKEFLKVSYEHGYNRFRGIEKQIVDMQQEVFKLQEEFGDAMIIEDGEARTLMATSALKSCLEALTTLQKKQDKVAKEAVAAHDKIKSAREKFEPLRDEYLPEGERSSPGDANKPAKPFKSKEVKKELETMCEEIKDHFEAGEGSSLTVTELADRIDELVTKVIGVETDISGETALVRRLKIETDELQAQIQELENEKPNLEIGSEDLIKKLKEMDAKMQAVHEIDLKVTDQNQKLETIFTESRCNLAHLSQKMSSVRPDEELDAIAEVPAVREKKSKKSKKEKGEKKSKKKKKERELELTDSSQIEEQVEESQNSKQGKELEVEEPEESQDQKHEITGSSPMVEAAGEAENSHATEDSTGEVNLKEVTEKREEQTTPAGKEEALDTSPEKADDTPPTEKADDTPPEKADDTTPAEKADDTPPEKADDTLPDKAPDTPQAEKADDTLPEKDNNTPPEEALDSPPEKAYNSTAEQANDTLPEKGPEGRQKKSLRNLFEEHADSFKRKAPVEEDILLDAGRPETLDEDLEEPNWHDMFKEGQKKLQDVEKKAEDGLFHTTIHVKELTNANTKKDEEIRSLRQKLKHLQAKLESIKDETDKNKNPETSSTQVEEDEEDIYDMKFLLQNVSNEISETEMRFREDIDELLEENLDFWLRFSASFHQIQKFENEIQDLKADALKIIKEKKGEGSNTRRTSLKAEARSIYRHMSEINTELGLWLETSAKLKEELQSRFSAICCIQEEITKALKDSAEDEDFKFTSFIAAKFQGEILNMKQENNKVADELRAGSDHVSGIQAQVEKSLTKLDDEFGFTGARNASGNLQQSESRSRVPLRSFIFGGRQKKQSRPVASIFASVTPALNRKYNIIKQGVQM